MILLSITMFILGVMAFFDAFFNYGNTFRFIFAGLLVCMSVWVYLKTKDLRDLGKPYMTTSEKFGTDKIKVPMTEHKEEAEKKPETVHH